MDILITTLSLINANRFCWESYDHPVRIREKNGAVYKLPEKVSDKNQTDHYAISRQVEKEDGTIVEEKEEIEYEKVAGRFTNEAPARYLLQRKLEETYTFFDKIIILGTSECKNDKIRDLFKKAIEKAKGETKNIAVGNNS